MSAPVESDRVTEGFCQYVTELNRYGLPASTCGAPAVEHRPDRVFVRFVCEDHREEGR